MNFANYNFTGAPTAEPLPRARRSKSARARGALVLRTNVVGEQLGEPRVLNRRRRQLSSIVARHALKNRPYIVSLHRRGDTLKPQDHTVRLRKTWSATLVGPNDIVLITQVPLGDSAGGNAGKQIGGALALVALAIAVPWAIGFLGPTFATAAGLTFAGKALAAGIVIGGAWLISKATQPKSQADENRQLYGVQGGGTLPRPGDHIPAGYGSYWLQPDLTQPDYTVYDGEDQILYKRATIGLGKYQIEEIQLGTATLWTLGGGVQAPFNGAPGGSSSGQVGNTGSVGGGGSGSSTGAAVEIILPGGASTLVPASVYSSPSVGGTELPRPNDNPVFAGPFAVCPVGETTHIIQLDYSLPNGVYHTSGTGQIVAPWNVNFEIAPCDEDDNPTAAWVSLWQHGAAALKTTHPQRFTKIIDVVSASRYLVRARNQEAEVENRTNTITWDGLRSHFDETITRPHVTEIAIRVRSGKALGITAFGDIWVKVTRILPTWTGSSWVEAPTRKAIYAYYDVLKATYGGNLPDNEIDVERIKHYATTLTENDTFDGMIRGPVSLYEAGSTVLGVIRAEPARIGNTWSLNRDEAKTARKHKFTRRQIERGSSVISMDIDRSNGETDVILEYNPDADPRRRRNVRVTFGPESITPQRMQAFGVSNYDQAYHLATWRAVVAYRRCERHRFTTELQGRLLSRGDPTAVDTWFISESRAAGVLSIDGLEFTLDTAVEWPAVEGSPDFYAAFRDRRGREWGPVLVTQGSAPNVIVLDDIDVAAAEDESLISLDAMLANDNEDMTSVVVGPLDLQRFLINSVEPQGKDRIAVEAMLDDDDVWTTLGEDPPPQPEIPSTNDDVDPPFANIPYIYARAIQKGLGLAMEWTVGRARGAVSYIVRLSYDNGATWEPVHDGIETSGNYPIRDEVGINVKVGAWAVNRHGAPGVAVYASFTTFSPKIGLPNLEDVLRERVTDEFRKGNLARDRAERIIASSGAAALAHVFRGKIKERLNTFNNRIDAIKRDIDLQTNIDDANGNLLTLTNRVEVGFGDNDNSLAFLETTYTLFAGPNGTFANYQITVGTRFNDNEASIILNATSITNLEFAFAQYQVTVEARFDAAEASILITANALATLDGAFAAYQLLVTARFQINEASIALNATALSDLTGSFAAYQIIVTARFDSNEASIILNANAISDLSGTFAEFSITANARLGNVEASASQNATAISTLSGSFSNYQITVNARVDGIEASASLALTAVNNINGQLAAAAILRVSAGTKVTGFKIFNSSLETSFDIDTDYFRVGREGVTGFVPVFQVGTVEGNQTIALRGDVFADGTIVTRHLATGSVKTDALDARVVNTEKLTVNGVEFINILAGAVGNEVIQSHGASVGLGTLLSATATVRNGTAKVFYSGQLTFSANATIPVMNLTLLVDGVSQYTWTMTGKQIVGSNTFQWDGPVILARTIQGLSNGSHTFRIDAATALGSFSPGQLTVTVMDK